MAAAEISKPETEMEIFRVFEGAFGKPGTEEGAKVALASFNANPAALSLGEKSGQIYTATSVESAAEIRKWVELANPKLFSMVVCDEKRFTKMKEHFEKKAAKNAGKDTKNYADWVKRVAKKCKDELAKLFSIGTQIRRKEKCCRLVFFLFMFEFFVNHKMEKFLRKQWVKMLSALKNGIFADAEAMFAENKRLEKSRQKLHIVDFDISSSKETFAVLYQTGAAYLYSFKTSSILLCGF